MARPLNLTITETTEELKKRLEKTTKARSQERLLLLYWLKIGKVQSRKELALLLSRDVATITRWLKKSRQGGLLELLEAPKKRTKSSLVSQEILIRLKERLSEPEGFKNSGEVQQWLENNYKIKIACKTVYKIVHDKLQAKLKVPRPSHNQGSQFAKSHFKKV